MLINAVPGKGMTGSGGDPRPKLAMA
jgi:hypothetical protein